VSRPRLGLLAAGGVAGIVVAQVWGLGLNIARATDAGSATGPAAAQLTGDGDLLGIALPAGGTALPVGATALPAGATALLIGGIDGLVRDRIRDGGLPLPGQASGLPDAFAIAAGLLPPVPARPGSPRDPVAAAGPEPAAPAAGTTVPRSPRPGPAAPQSGTAGQTNDAGAGPGSVPASRPSQEPTERAGADGAVAGVTVADGGSAPGIEQSSPSRAANRGTRRAVNWLPGQKDAPAAAQANSDQPTTPQDSEPYLADRVERAVLIPIAAGLLLTGAAMYKHRGLPRGHGQ
jgi:hypothetical protein